MFVGHLISAIIFIICFVLELILSATRSKNEDLLSLIGLIICFSGAISLALGIDVHDDLYWRKRHNPDVEDVNNGYATIYTYTYDKDHDGTIDTVYSIEWNGTNKTGVRDSNF